MRTISPVGVAPFGSLRSRADLGRVWGWVGLLGFGTARPRSDPSRFHGVGSRRCALAWTAVEAMCKDWHCKDADLGTQTRADWNDFAITAADIPAPEQTKTAPGFLNGARGLMVFSMQRPKLTEMGCSGEGGAP